MSHKYLHVGSKTYTSFKLLFGLFEEQQQLARDWVDRHLEEAHPESEFGAIGGPITYSFTPTSLGVVTKVTCYCGDGIDISDYDLW